MQNNAITKPAPADILGELTDWGISDFRELLNDLFTSYVCTEEWGEFTDEWKRENSLRFRALNRFFDKTEAWNNEEMAKPSDS